MTVHNFSVNDDSLSGSMAHNYYLYEANGRISILPWDYNLSLGGMHAGDATSVINDPVDEPWRGTKLFDFVLTNEEYKTRYHEYYERLVNEYLYGGKFEETYNRIRTQIYTLAKFTARQLHKLMPLQAQYTKKRGDFMRLLVCEDEKHLNKTLTERLTKIGYTVDNCFDGEDALYYIENTKYDGIILDVMMPKINGFEVLLRMRKEKILTPVLVLTAKDSDEDIIAGLDIGAKGNTASGKCA